MEGCQIEGNGTAYIAKGLGLNKTLQYLYLNGNKVNYQGALVLAKVLNKENVSLRNMVLYNNQLNEADKTVIKRMGGDRISIHNPLN